MSVREMVEIVLLVICVRKTILEIAVKLFSAFRKIISDCPEGAAMFHLMISLHVMGTPISPVLLMPVLPYNIWGFLMVTALLVLSYAMMFLFLCSMTIISISFRKFLMKSQEEVELKWKEKGYPIED